jgi:hypothetical protein
MSGELTWTFLGEKGIQGYCQAQRVNNRGHGTWHILSTFHSDQHGQCVGFVMCNCVLS